MKKKNDDKCYVIYFENGTYQVIRGDSFFDALVKAKITSTAGVVGQHPGDTPQYEFDAVEKKWKSIETHPTPP